MGRYRNVFQIMLMGRAPRRLDTMRTSDRPIGIDVSTIERLSFRQLLALDVLLLGVLVFAVQPWVAVVGGLGAISGYLLHGAGESR